jgi:hypothetical protein
MEGIGSLSVDLRLLFIMIFAMFWIVFLLKVLDLTTLIEAKARGMER